MVKPKHKPKTRRHAPLAVPVSYARPKKNLSPREINDQLNARIEEYLANIDDQSGKCISGAIERTLGITQQHLITDLEKLAQEAGRALADELNENVFSLANSWFDQRRGDMMIMPEGIKFAHRQGNSLYLVLEEKPTVRTVSYSGGGDKRIRKYRLALPYVIFLFQFQLFMGEDDRIHLTVQQFKVAFAKQPIMSLDQILYIPPLPNLEVQNTGTEFLRVCMGQEFINPLNRNLPEQVKSSIDHWWQAAFGTDWANAFIDMGNRDERFKTFKAWEKASEGNSLFVLEAPYQEAGTLSEILKTGFEDEGIDTPLRRMIQKTVSRLCDSVADRIRTVEIGVEYKDKFAVDSVQRVVMGGVRQCLQGMSGTILSKEYSKIADEKIRIESGLHELLYELEKRVEAREANGYWYKK